MDSAYSNDYELSDLSIWGNRNIRLVLNAGGYYMPTIIAEGLSISLAQQSTFTFISKLNAVLSFCFDSHSSDRGMLTVKLGEQVLLSQSIRGSVSSRVYFAVSPGRNNLSFSYSGPHNFSIFDPESSDSRKLGLTIINPKVQIISC